MLLSAGNDDGRRLTPALVRRRLAGRGTDGGPTEATPPGLTLAAVLVPLVTHADGLAALFTRRTDHLADHAAQVSFPGGRVEAGDRDRVATALREAHEEIGLAPDTVEIIGMLDAQDTSTGFSVVPVVGLVAPVYSLDLDDFEVAEAFEVPLEFLFDGRNKRREEMFWRGRLRVYDVYDDYEGHKVWGVTARIIGSLQEAVTNVTKS